MPPDRGPSVASELWDNHRKAIKHRENQYVSGEVRVQYTVLTSCMNLLHQDGEDFDCQLKPGHVEDMIQQMARTGTWLVGARAMIDTNAADGPIASENLTIILLRNRSRSMEMLTQIGNECVGIGMWPGI